MAMITSHTLNGLDGSHAGGIKVTLFVVGDNKALISAEMDAGGRLSIEIEPTRIDVLKTYELVFHAEKYWQSRGVSGENLMTEIVLRFKMPKPDGKYHMPMILSPYSYSTWKSG